MNRIYFGSGAYGVEQAAGIYFGKATSQLQSRQCAMLVGIVRGPHIFSPLRNLPAAEEQRKQTLDRMVDAGFISRERADAVGKLEIRLSKDEPNGTRQSYALRQVQNELERIQEKENIVLGGLTVNTTLDAGMAGTARIRTDSSCDWFWRARRAGHIHGTRILWLVVQTDYLQYAAVTRRPKLALCWPLVGGRDYSHSAYDRTRSKRDLGSAFEPFVAGCGCGAR